jgi:hypothetical protein
LLVRRWPEGCGSDQFYDECVYQTLRMLVICAPRVRVERRLHAAAACFFLQVEQ